MKIEKAKVLLIMFYFSNYRSAPFAIFLLVVSCSLRNDDLGGEYELNGLRDYSSCLIEFREGGKGVIDCDGPIQINWLAASDDIVLIDFREVHLIFDPVDFDTTWNSVKAVKWKSRGASELTLKLIQ